ncbi:MAG: hypothetical protein FWE70_05160, partial [Oscillospiraceae bacterium]|nr:hypothetical protein [Oscillospiraceae bacterium]
MERILDVRFTGNIHERKGDARSPESFPLPACMASLAEALGIDPAWIEIEAHGRKWSKRTLYDDVLACTGMAFGLLWHDEACHSCLDLTQVNPHDRTIALAFDRIGYGHEVVMKDGVNYAAVKGRIVSSVDAGKPVLAFGLIGPPECGIICGYGDSGDTLYGWSHFQSHDPAHCHANGMFKADAGYGWYGRAWKFAFCG